MRSPSERNSSCRLTARNAVRGPPADRHSRRLREPHCPGRARAGSPLAPCPLAVPGRAAAVSSRGACGTGSGGARPADPPATTWASPSARAPPGPGPGGPAPLPQTPDQLTARLRAAVAAGQETVGGRPIVDGQRAIELRSGSVSTAEIETWVSPASYLP